MVPCMHRVYSQGQVWGDGNVMGVLRCVCERRAARWSLEGSLGLRDPLFGKCPSQVRIGKEGIKIWLGGGWYL